MTKKLAGWLLLILALFCPACDVGYLFHAAMGQFRLINASIPIQEALNSHALTPAEAARLRLVARITDFGERELGLRETQNYETVYLASPNRPIYTISASPKDRLSRKTWWFPFVGYMPYLGFFDLEKAKKKRDELVAQDLDVCIGVADAYSTLGWFEDPVTLNLIQGSTPDLAETILHEMTHTTLYLKDQSAFNEGLAVLVGKVGAFLFLEQDFGPSHPFTQEAKASIQDERLFSSYLNLLMNELEKLYVSSLSYEEKLTEREMIFTKSKNTFYQLKRRLHTDRFTRFGQRSLNNAYILSVALYHRHFGLFEAVLTRKGGSIRETLLFFKALSRQNDDVLKSAEAWLETSSTLTHETRRMRSPAGLPHQKHGRYLCTSAVSTRP